ncbi:beta-L-arabinofuranosidase domain-containing protein [Duganella fentianensis]|uniref:beta-L-arabinofuranosidase domain-containing protein n=1 Tax=Duganella fentianensis TaxID=2692177 RepID=UPI003531525E
MRTVWLLVALLPAGSSVAAASTPSAPLQLFPLADVRLGASPFLDAQRTDLRYILEMEPDRLLAPFLREAGLPPKQASYGNWESSGLDGHLGGHYLSALALMYASTGDAEVLRRMNYFVAELKRCQQQNGNGYIGGIPDGSAAWQAIARGELHADNFSVNGKWVPWYNLHKLYAGLRDAYQYGGNADARDMLVAMADWALVLTSHLSEEQMQAMLRSEHGGMNEVLADVAQMTGQRKYLDLAIRFSQPGLMQPLAQGQDQLTGMHANTQIPKVIGYQRIGSMTGRAEWQQAAQFFWQTVHDHRTVAIGGNSVKEHFHDVQGFSPMINEVEGPETCNTYNMLKLTALLFQRDSRASYADYYERALYNHILSSQRPDTGGFVYFTPMRPNHYRVYSQVDKGMWCCVGSGIESHAKYGEFIYAHRGDELYVNLFIPSTLNWRERGISVTQYGRFPEEDRSMLRIAGNASFTLKIRYPAWVAAGAMKVRVNGQLVKVQTGSDHYLSLRRQWRDGDQVEVQLPMTTRLEQMPDQSNYYALLHGPVVLAAKTRPFGDEKLNFLADESRMGHVAQGPVCPLEASPMLVSDSKDFLQRLRPVPGQPLTFSATGLVQQPGQGQGSGARDSSVTFIPFYRLHDSRYVIYWPYSTPANLDALRQKTAQSEAARLALDARTIDQVAPGEQQPESDHGFRGEGADAGLNQGRHWRHASGWFSYQLNDVKREARVLRLTYARGDAGRRFDIRINGHLLAEVTLTASAAEEFYTVDYALPADLLNDGKWEVRFEARAGSMAGGLYGLRLLR